jgi:hypothetical protein
LLNDPLRAGMVGHGEMKHLPSGVADHEENPQQLKGGGGYREEIHAT